VGKSSLINALPGTERSMVSPVAGTTRDARSAVLELPEGKVLLVDVAGEEAAVDEMRGRMMEARRMALLDADLVVQVIDEEESPGAGVEEEICGARIVVRNKCDLMAGGGRDALAARGTARGACLLLSVSAKTGENLERLKEAIGRHAIHRVPQGERSFALNQRHRMIFHELQQVLWRGAALARGEGDFRRHPELVAAEVRYGLDLLGQMTGAISPDEVLGRVFARFCIGK
ncbi:MAG TPA: GTPase, partial [Phycisphaerae bacterium]|nr:GTPase [Phycisphaerae bacterium]